MKELVRLVDRLAVHVTFHLIITLVMTLTSPTAGASDLQSEIVAMTREFDTAQFGTEPGAARVRAVESVDRHAERLLKQFPDEAQTLCWRAWALLAKSAVTQEFAAIEMQEQALFLLQSAVALDERVFDGEPYVTLGELNLRGAAFPFPIRFGLKEKGRQYFLQALNLNPTGLQSNLGYARYFFHYEKDYPQALKFAEAASKAPPLSDRAVADKALRAEARDLVASAAQKIKESH